MRKMSGDGEELVGEPGAKLEAKLVKAFELLEVVCDHHGHCGLVDIGVACIYPATAASRRRRRPRCVEYERFDLAEGPAEVVRREMVGRWGGNTVVERFGERGKVMLKKMVEVLLVTILLALEGDGSPKEGLDEEVEGFGRNFEAEEPALLVGDKADDMYEDVVWERVEGASGAFGEEGRRISDALCCFSARQPTASLICA